MALRLRQHKRVAMGLSHVAGWGAFAQACLCFIVNKELHILLVLDGASLGAAASYALTALGSFLGVLHY